MSAKLDAIRSLAVAVERAKMGGDLTFHALEGMAGELRLAAAKLDRINLDRCNGIERWDEKAKRRLASWNDDDEARAEKAQDKARARVMAVIERLNAVCNCFSIEFGGDPRGSSVKLLVGSDPQPAAYF